MTICKELIFLEWFSDLSFWAVCILVLTAFLAGIIDALAGGGGLITVPIMIAVGISPIEALATNKLQGCAGTLSASHHFIKLGHVSLREMRFPIFMTAIGSLTGTLLVTYINTAILLRIIPAILIFVAIFFYALPKLQPVISSFVRITMNRFAFIAGFSIGFYDGLIGPGTGAFFSTAFICLMGLSIISATAHTKVLNATSNLTSLVVFCFSGHILWGIGIAMGAGQWLGAKIGSRLVISKGNTLIRPLVITICIALSIKLLLS